MEDTYLRSGRISRVLQIAFVALLAALVAGVSPEEASAVIDVTGPTGSEIVSESDDFPSRRFLDPWDMSSRLDLSHGEYYSQLKNIRWGANGIFMATSTGTDAHVYPLFPGYLGGLPNGRDGKINRFSTATYNRFSIRLYSSRATSAQFIWLYNQVFTRVGVKTFAVQPGWNIYTVNPTGGTWDGRPMGLRFDPTDRKDVQFKIDWLRLYTHSNSTIPVTWTDSSPGGTASVYLDDDTDSSNGTLGLLTTQASGATNSYNWNTSAYPPGTYYIRVEKSGQGDYSGAATINAIPLTNIINPDERGGRNYASAHSGGPWDMRQPDDINHITDIGDISFNNGILAGTTLSRDSFFHLRTLNPIDSARYHRLTFRYRYSGKFNYGLGTMVRFIWSPNEHELSQYQTIKDIVAYPRWTTYYIDLKKAPLSHGSIGWNGNVDVFRFDPLETPPGRRFFLDYVRLSADDSANRQFTLKWKDNRVNPRPTRVSFFRDTNRKGFNGTRIRADILQTSGTNKFTWNTTNVPAGTYWIYAVATDGISTARRYTTGPLVISH